MVNKDFLILLEDLPFYQVIYLGRDHQITSSNIVIPAQTFSENYPAWQVFKTKAFALSLTQAVSSRK